MRQSRAALGWGAALLVLGMVLLLRNAGMFPAELAVWPWPLLGAGVALLILSAAQRSPDVTVGLVLTVAGAIFALRETGLLGEVPVVPLVLVTVGMILVASALKRRSAAVAPEHLSVPLNGAEAVRLSVIYGAGNLRVTGFDSDTVACEGTFAGGVARETRKTGERLEVSLRPPAGWDSLLWTGTRPDWDLAVTNSVPMDLEIHTGASRVRLDLEHLALRSLIVKTGVADVRVDLPSRGRYRVEIEAGAAEVALRVPNEVSGSIVTRSGLASVEIDKTRFPRVNGVHRSAGYDDAENRAEIEIEGGLAAFSVR